MKQAAAPLIFGLLLALAGIGLLASPLGVRLEEDLGLALLFKLRGPVEPPGGIVIVNVDEEAGDFEAAIYWFDRARQLNPRAPTPLLNLLNFPTLIATKASRVADAARPR